MSLTQVALAAFDRSIFLARNAGARRTRFEYSSTLARLFTVTRFDISRCKNRCIDGVTLPAVH